MKILNLYAGIGGNRKLWYDCDVTAVEIEPDIAAVYQTFFPDDTVIVGDAHQYLLDHYHEFDFIWASPPCQSHSRLKKMLHKKAYYPDMTLYQEIIFLSACPSHWVVENVTPYYEPLVSPSFKIGRHLYWSNVVVSSLTERKISIPHDSIRWSDADRVTFINKHLNIDLSILDNFSLRRKRQLLNNCVLPEIGLHIYEQMRKNAGLNTRIIQESTIEDFLNEVQP